MMDRSLELASSPMAPGVSPVHVAYSDRGTGSPLVFLHGGWGYAFYPVQRPEGVRLVIPERTGYGRSTRIAKLPPHFHAAAAFEHERFLDALGIERCVLWGHSDGAVIAARMAIEHPGRYAGVILEALHLDREKRASRAFFTMMAEDPDGFGERVTSKLAADHGETWRDVLRAGGRAWLDIAATPDEDFFDGRLGELRVPVMVLHGAEDPRTEPGELDRVIREVPSYEWRLIPRGGHCPHSEKASREECRELVGAFVRRVTGTAAPHNRVTFHLPPGRLADLRVGLVGEELGTRIGSVVADMGLHHGGQPVRDSVTFLRVPPDEYEACLVGSSRAITFVIDESSSALELALTERDRFSLRLAAARARAPANTRTDRGR